MRGLLRTASLAALAVVPAVALAASASSHVLAPNCNKALYKPSTIIVACGDANTYVNKLKWSSWSTTKATGKGDFAYNTCTPSCASGHIKSYAVTANLSKPKSCKQEKHKVFGKLAVAFTGTPPSHLQSTYALACPF